MTLGSNYICTYADLRNYALKQLKAKCCNIDAISDSIPTMA